MKRLLRILSERIIALRDKWFIPQTSSGGKLAVMLSIPLVVLCEFSCKFNESGIGRTLVYITSAPFRIIARIWKEMFPDTIEGALIEAVVLAAAAMGLFALVVR